MGAFGKCHCSFSVLVLQYSRRDSNLGKKASSRHMSLPGEDPKLAGQIFSSV